MHLLRGKKVILSQNDIKERAEKHETKLECNKGNYRKFVEMELEKGLLSWLQDWLRWEQINWVNFNIKSKLVQI